MYGWMAAVHVCIYNSIAVSYHVWLDDISSCVYIYIYNSIAVSYHVWLDDISSCVHIYIIV